MKSRHRSVLILSILLTSAGTAQDWNITGAGARAEGFGGAFIGIADDATAIVWNPAGLGQLERAEVSTVGRYITETSEFKSMLPSDSYTESNTQSHFNFNFASLAVPFSAGSTNIVVAVAYQTQLDFYSKYTDISKDQTEGTGAASTITPGVAVRFGSMFSLGLATNIWMGSFDYSTKYATGEIWKSNPEFSGLNFGVGALLDFGGLPNPIPLKLGVAVKTPFTLEADVDYTYNGDPGKYKAEVEMPLMLGVGASYQIGQNFTVAVDYETRRYEDKKLTTTESGTSSSDLLSDSNENLDQVRVGAEYLIVMKGGVIPLRGGFHTVPTVLANYAWNRDSLSYYPSGQVSGRGFSVGTGFISSHFALDFAYSHDQYDEQTWSDAGVNDFTNNYQADRFSLSLIVYF
jgi:long-subunit fatty acid transport protein